MTGALPFVVALAFIFFMFGGVQMVTRLIEGRRKYLLDMKEQETRIAEAKAKEREIEQKRAELEYREALLEIERFDRRLRPDLRPPEPPSPKPPPPEPPAPE